MGVFTASSELYFYPQPYSQWTPALWFYINTCVGRHTYVCFYLFSSCKPLWHDMWSSCWPLRYEGQGQSLLRSPRFVCLFGWFLNAFVNNLAISRTGPETDVWQFHVLPHTRQNGETMTSVSAGHIILTPTQSVGSGWSQRELNPGPPHQESRALPTDRLDSGT